MGIIVRVIIVITTVLTTTLIVTEDSTIDITIATIVTDIILEVAWLFVSAVIQTEGTTIRNTTAKDIITTRNIVKKR